MNKNNTQVHSEFWRSIDEYIHGKKIKDDVLAEFPESIKEAFEPNMLPKVSRRKFMALLGASSAFAMAACSDYRDKGEIISYNDKPEYANYGDAVYYASSLNNGAGILIKTREGRPIKIDGNPDHPINKGKIMPQGQAAIINLYDPERLKQPLKKSDSKLMLNKDDLLKNKWEEIDQEIIDKLNKAVDREKEIAVITHSVLSPTQKKIFDDFVNKYPTAKIYSYELHNDNNKRIAWENSYSTDSVPSIKWDEANIILTLEADILGNEGNVIETVGKYSERRNANNADNFNRLYSVEASMSLTGLNSDYRLRLTPAKQAEFVLSLIAEIKKGITFDSTKYPNNISAKSLNDFAKENGMDIKKLNYLVADLLANKGKAIVFAGEKLPVEVHEYVLLLNELLENSKLYDFSKAEILQMPLTGLADFHKSLKNGNIDILINFDANPVYHQNIDIELINKIDTKISLLEIQNETSVNNDYLLPINNELESWNDFNIQSGIFSLQQPVIAPLYSSRQKEAILLNWMNGNPNEYSDDIYHKYLMNRWENEIYPKLNSASDFKKFWYASLHDGIITVPLNNDSESKPEFSLTALKQSSITAGFTLVLNRNYSIADGRYANNGWLQELPHPISKVAWDNYAAIAPGTAKELGVKNNDLVEIEHNGNKILLPVIEQPGMAEQVIVTELGYGRTVAGDIGNNVGVNANIILDFESSTPWINTGINVKKTGEEYEVYSTQEHHPVDEEFVKDFHFKRDIIREGTVEEYKKDHHFLKHNEHNIESINALREYPGHKWAMAIDLNKCTSCNNCVVACNVENNVPVVGKEQVGKGREMHWIRLDRYYSGTPEEPKISIQPMLCQHCDHAPCENVCPVVATTHSEDGLNQMVYNRCVGTRYCANNCPFKVRRFNFFNFRSELADGFYQQDSVNLSHNPEVTVRSRGVMEKCSFCVQRIMEAREEAIKDGRELLTDEVKTACQVACPADAITFGDANDKESEISKLKEHDLAYHVLELLNVRPNISYIAKLRNTYSEEL